MHNQDAEQRKGTPQSGHRIPPKLPRASFLSFLLPALLSLTATPLGLALLILPFPECHVNGVSMEPSETGFSSSTVPDPNGSVRHSSLLCTAEYCSMIYRYHCSSVPPPKDSCFGNYEQSCYKPCVQVFV